MAKASKGKFVVQVTTFQNPSLFWFVYEKDISARKRLCISLSRRKNYCKPSLGQEEGKAVIIHYDDEWLRATVVEIRDEANKKNFVCWLWDYGVFVEVNQTYIIFSDIKHIPPFAKKAQLFGLRSILKHFEFSKNEFQETHTKEWSCAVRNCVLEILNNPKNVQLFEEKCIFGDSVVGILCITNEKEGIFDVADAIVGRGYAKYEPDEVKFFSFLYKERNAFNDFPLKQLYNVTRGMKLPMIFIGNSKIKSAGRGKHRFKSKASKTASYSSTVLGASNQQIDQTTDCCDDTKDFFANIRSEPSKQSSLVVHETKSRESSDHEWFEEENAMSKKIAAKRNKKLGVDVDNDNASRKNESDAKLVKDLENTSEPVEEKNFYGHVKKEIGVFKMYPAGSSVADAPDIKISFNMDSKKNTQKDRHVVFNASSSEDSFKNVNESQNYNTSSRAFVNLNDNKQDTLSSNGESFRNRKSNDKEKVEENIINLTDRKIPGCPDNPLMIKKCPCDTCESVRNNTMMFQNYKEKKRVPKIKEITKPTLLFSESLEESPHCIKTRKITQSNLQRLLEPKILVHGKYVIHPVKDLCSVSFDPTVHQTLQRLKYSEPLKTQSFAWPAIMRGQNVFIVSGPDSGKTMSYIPPICTFVLSKPPDLPNVNGPVALVLCPGVKTAENVYKMFNKLLDLRREKIIRLAIPPFNIQQKSQILKGVDVLICTPKTLIILLKEKIISFKKLIHVVLEDSNILFNLFAAEMDILLKVFQKVLVKRIYPQSIQLTVVSEQWSVGLETLAKQLHNTPLICISALLEAALYGRVDIQIQIVQVEEKPYKLIELLAERFKTDKSIVFCNDLSEVSTALEYLSAHGIDYELITQESNAEHRRHVCVRWENATSGSYFILVTTDEPINTELSITDAGIVIQYSLPNTSWSQFTFRFSCFLNNYKSPLGVEKGDVIQSKMYILVDETNTLQFPRMVQFLERMGCNISNNILTYNKKMTLEMEHSKLTKKVELCPQLSYLGVCPLPGAVCKFRHVLSKELDVLPFLPQSGLIKLKILYVVSPISYYCRLIEHTDAEDSRHEIKDQFAYIAVQLAKLVDEKVRKPVLTAKLNGVYAVEETEGVFRRCRVIKVSGTDVLDRSTGFIVHFIDFGLQKYVSNCFYILPEEICAIPPQAVKVIIGDLGPLDKDSDFSENCRKLMQHEFKMADYDNTNYYFIGRIMLQLANSIYVENLVLQEVLDNGTLFLNKLNIREMLFKRNVAESRSLILDNLYKLCDDYHLDLPDYSLPVVKMAKCIPTQKEPAWAHLENLEDFNKVFFASGCNPDLFYVKLCKNQILMNDLQKAIVKCMNRPLYPTGCAVVVGRCYLAKDFGGPNYERVLVTDLTDKSANCFFVDYGDHAQIPIEDVRYLPDELITKLPFQVIECKLFGIKPKILTWKNEATDILYTIAFEPNTDLLKFLHVKVMDSSSAEVTGYKKYSVVVVDVFEANTIINNLLVERGFAKFTQNSPLEVDFEKINNVSECDSDLCSDTENNNFEGVYSDEPQEVYFEEDPDDALDQFEFFANDMKTFMQELFPNANPNKAEALALPPIEKPAESSPQQSVANIKPPKSSPGYSTPKVIWEQTDSTITLKIKIIDAEEYDIFILRNKVFSFKTNSKDVTYKLHLNLFSKVASEVRHSSTGLQIVVALTKEVPGEWPRLISTRDKMRNIIYNVNSISVELDSDEESAVDPKTIAKHKAAGAFAEMTQEQNGYYYTIGSDDDNDESEFDSASDSDA